MRAPRRREDGDPINDELLDAIREFTGTILNPYDLQELLHRLTQHAIQAVGAMGAGIMLADEAGELGFVAASEEKVVAAEEFQDRIKAGACYQAFTTNEVVVADDLEADERWPEYAAHVTALGLRSVIGIPMNAHGQTIGVINIYRDAPTHWSGDDLATAEILAAMGAGYILNTSQMKAQHTLAEQLEAAIASRDLIGQAKGILMAEAGVDADRAFDLLRLRSQQQNRKLKDVASELVEQRAKRLGRSD